MKKYKILRKIFSLIILISIAFPVSIYAAVPASDPNQAPNQPLIEILSTTDEFIEVYVRYPANPIFDNGGSAIFDENIYNHPSNDGDFDLPVLRTDIKLPFGSNYSVEIIDYSAHYEPLGADGLPSIIPVRAPDEQKCDPVDDNCLLPEEETQEATPTATPEEETQEATPTATPEEETQEATPTETPVVENIDNPEGDGVETIEDETLDVPEEGAAIEEETPVVEETIEINSESLFPSTPVQLINTYTMRGHRIGQIESWPVQYDPLNEKLLIYETITFRINIANADLQLTSRNAAAYESPAFDKLLADNILNFDKDDDSLSIKNVAQEGILIIAPQAFMSTLSSLATLKESQGHPVTSVSLSTTGSTPEAIKAYIQNAYNSWSLPPTYVLLVGDVNNGSNTMPAFIGESTQTVTDLYYGTVDGTDWIPDIFVGRLPARDTTQLNRMINNLTAYNNLTGSEGWVKKAAFLASDDPNYWQVAEATQNYVIQNHTQPAGYTGTFPTSPQAGGDKLYAHTYSAGNSNVINAINNRRSLISYTGHGSTGGWGGPSFGQANVRNINHTGTYSVVTSFACVTGDFSVQESFGETWLLQENKGAVAFIGSSANSYWGGDDVLERAMMDALYSGTQSATIVSYFRHAGLMAVEESRPGTGTAQSRYYWETYNLLGDPSLKMLIKPKASDFTLSVDPSSLNVCQNASNTATVSLGQVNGFNNQVTLSMSTLPTGVTAGFSPNPVTPSGASTLTLSASSNAPLGQYSLAVKGESGSLQHSADLSLSVFDNPQSVITSSPAHLATGVSITPTFVWEEAQPNQTYEIQVSLNSAFTQLVISQTGLTQPSFTPTTPLDSSTIYYWRVRATNPCGSSAFSNAQQFETLAAPGDCPVDLTPTLLYKTDFESSPAAWQNYGTNDSWIRNANRSFSPNNAFFSEGKNNQSKQHLTSPLISLPNTSGNPVTLKFWQWFEIEAGTSTCFDGAILEISIDGGQTWSQIDNSKLLTTPYNGTISSSYGNPLAGRQAWCGSRDWSQTVVDLTQYGGQDIKLRFTHATDSNVGLEGWYVDDFAIQSCENNPEYRPRFNTAASGFDIIPGETVTVSLELTNTGTKNDSFTLNMATNNWVASIQTRETIQLSPGETTTVEISILVPEDAESGQTEEFILSVISDYDPHQPQAKDITTIEIKARMDNTVFLPVFNN